MLQDYFSFSMDLNFSLSYTFIFFCFVMDLQCEYGPQVASRCPYLPPRMLRGYGTNWGNILNNLREKPFTQTHFHIFTISHFHFFRRRQFLLIWLQLFPFYRYNHLNLLKNLKICAKVCLVIIFFAFLPVAHVLTNLKPNFQRNHWWKNKGTICRKRKVLSFTENILCWSQFVNILETALMWKEIKVNQSNSTDSIQRNIIKGFEKDREK